MKKSSGIFVLTESYCSEIVYSRFYPRIRGIGNPRGPNYFIFQDQTKFLASHAFGSLGIPT